MVALNDAHDANNVNAAHGVRVAPWSNGPERVPPASLCQDAIYDDYSAAVCAASDACAALARAAALLDGDPDDAALVLDGLVPRLVEDWYAAHGLAVPERPALLADLQQRFPLLARRVRLALRAPHVRARLAHARALAAELASASPVLARQPIPLIPRDDKS